MKKIFALVSAGAVLFGCNGATDEGKELTDAELQQKTQQAATDPNLPPQAKAAMEAARGQGKDYSGSQTK